MLVGGRGVAGKNTVQCAESTFPKKHLSGAYCHACKHLVLFHWFAPRRPSWVHGTSLVMTAAATQKKVTTHAWNALSDAAGLQNFQSALASKYAQCMSHNPLALATTDPCSIPLQHMIGDSPRGFVNSSVSAANAWTYIWSEWFFDVVEFTYTYLSLHANNLYTGCCVASVGLQETLFAAACLGSKCCGLSRRPWQMVRPTYFQTATAKILTST